MEKYKADLKEFRENLPLTTFCKTQTKRHIKPSEDFVEMVAEFKWPKNITLEVVEQFRKEYACHYKLRNCAMMVAQVRPGSFIITWYIPKSVSEKLKNRIPRDILQKYSATKLEIEGQSVFLGISIPCAKLLLVEKEEERSCKVKQKNTNDDKMQKLEFSYMKMLEHEMQQKRCSNELRKILRKPGCTVEAGVQLVQRSEYLAHDHNSVMSQVRNDLCQHSRPEKIFSLAEEHFPLTGGSKRDSDSDVSVDLDSHDIIVGSPTAIEYYSMPSPPPSSPPLRYPPLITFPPPLSHFPIPLHPLPIETDMTPSSTTVSTASRVLLPQPQLIDMTSSSTTVIEEGGRTVQLPQQSSLPPSSTTVSTVQRVSSLEELLQQYEDL